MFESAADQQNQFGKYELLDRIAAGGMAEIYRARYSPAPGVTKDIVIKKILPHYAANQGFIAMFTDEARIAMGLSHGNIAQVFDFGDIDGDYFIAMELVDGQPLSKVLRRAQAFEIPSFPPEFAAFVVMEQLKGLHYAHTRLDADGRPLHIVHRDVSPQNVLVSYEGQIKIVDFGIARARNAGKEDTEASAVKGKYTYFAPEQARARELDARTDVFASGVVLYELLTGQLPFGGKVMDALAKIVRGQFQRPREVNPNVPLELEGIVLKAMALEKNDRYATAEAFQQDLSRYLAAKHPDFSPSRLAHFLQLLFEEDLVAQSRPVKLPRQFVEEALQWKSSTILNPISAVDIEVAPPPGEDAATVANPLPAGLGRADAPRLPELGDLRPKKRKSAGRRPKRMLPVLLLGAASVAVGVGAVLVAHRFTRATVEVVSSPQGATVKLDGVPQPGRTPLTLQGLEGGRTAHLEVDVPGYLPWTNDVPLRRGQHLVVEATLQWEPPPPPPPPLAEPRPVGPPAPDAVTWPVERFTLDVARHSVDLAAAGGLSLPLDPNKTYTVRLGPGPTYGFGYYVVNAAGALPGPFTNAPLEIRGASRLFAFRVPTRVLTGEPGKEEPRPRPLTVAESKKRKAAVHRVTLDFTLPADRRVTLTGLEPSHTYALTITHGTPQARVRATGASISKVVVGHPSLGLVIVPLDTPTQLSGASQLFFTVLDDESDAQEGKLEASLVQVKEAPPAPRAPKRRRRR